MEILPVIWPGVSAEMERGKKMSVIMIDDEIYNQVSASLVHYLSRGKIWCYPYGKMAKEKDAKEFESIIRKEVMDWRNQNAISYDQRYKEDNGEIEPMKYRNTAPVSMVQLYKWLGSIEYQIETNYKSMLLEKAQKELAFCIISAGADYEKARWV